MVNLIFLTFVTFMGFHSNKSIPRIAEFMDANSVALHSFSAILFTFFLNILSPITTTRFKDIFRFHELKGKFLYHFLQGAMLSAVLVGGGLLAKYFHFLGFYVRFDEVVLSVFSAAMLLFGLFALITFEEYLLRKIFEPLFRIFGGTITILAASSVLFVFIKRFEFDLTLIEMLNFFILNVILFGIARKDHSHMASATFFVSFLFCSHTFFGLSFLGHDLPSIFLVRSLESDAPIEKLSELLSGGVRGPENGLILTVLLSVYLTLPWMRTQLIKNTSRKEQILHKYD